MYKISKINKIEKDFLYMIFLNELISSIANILKNIIIYKKTIFRTAPKTQKNVRSEFWLMNLPYIGINGFKTLIMLSTVNNNNRSVFPDKIAD